MLSEREILSTQKKGKKKINTNNHSKQKKFEKQKKRITNQKKTAKAKTKKNTMPWENADTKKTHSHTNPHTKKSNKIKK